MSVNETKLRPNKTIDNTRKKGSAFFLLSALVIGARIRSESFTLLILHISVDAADGIRYMDSSIVKWLQNTLTVENMTMEMKKDDDSNSSSRNNNNNNIQNYE